MFVTSFSHPISKLRFDALAGYARRMGAHVLSEELAWYESSNGRVVGTLIRDRYDNDFGGIIMGRDENGCFRCVTVTPFSDSPEIASNQLKAEMDDWSKRPPSAFAQGDMKRKALNLFTPVVPAHKLHPAFVRLAKAKQFSPARALMESMIPYYEDVDGNFVEQFQSSAFDARFWELYVFALLTEDKFVIDRAYSAPDFVCDGLYQGIFVEAVTVGPTRFGNIVIEPEPPLDAANLHDYMLEYMPIKWASALTSKLRKEYWKLLHVTDKPIVFAVQDFHAPRAMTYTVSTLLPYLYGRAFAYLYDSNGRLYVKSERIHKHRWQNKSIESGLFYLPGAERISAVIHNPTATISKFNRMARLAGMGSSAVRMLCFGTAYNHAPNAVLPVPFRYDIDDPSYTETWCEGRNVYHNPNALHPMDPGLFPTAMHHRLSGEDVVHTTPPFHPYSSTTLMIVPH